MNVRLKDGSTVHLVDVERDDDQAVIGTTDSGKRFATRRENVAKPLPTGRHHYRIYLPGQGGRDGQKGRPLYVLDPSFEDAEGWLLGDGDEVIEFTRDDGAPVQLARTDVLSVLSALPEDQALAEQRANGTVDIEA